MFQKIGKVTALQSRLKLCKQMIWNDWINKKHLKNVGPIRYCEPPHAHSPDVASGTVARRLRIDVHDDNDNAWQRGPLWPHGMGPMKAYRRGSGIHWKQKLSRELGYLSSKCLHSHIIPVAAVVPDSSLTVAAAAAEDLVNTSQQAGWEWTSSPSCSVHVVVGQHHTACSPAT